MPEQDDTTPIPDVTAPAAEYTTWKDTLHGCNCLSSSHLLVTLPSTAISF